MMDTDPLCGLSDCSSTSVRSSWSSSATEDSEDEWRHQVEELRWYIDPSSMQNGDTGKHVDKYEVCWANIKGDMIENESEKLEMDRSQIYGLGRKTFLRCNLFLYSSSAKRISILFCIEKP